MVLTVAGMIKLIVLKEKQLVGQKKIMKKLVLEWYLIHR